MSQNNFSSLEQSLCTIYDFKYNEVNNKLYFKSKNQETFKTLDDYHLNSIIRDLRACGVLAP